MDYYEILGVTQDATPVEIKKAFRQIARECHPDVTGDDPVAAERFKSARKAYETLIDPVTRSRYDRRGQKRKFAKGSFFDAFYRQTGPEPDPNAGKARPRAPAGWAAHDAGGHAGAKKKGGRDPGNDLDLEDLFQSFGDFGFTSGKGAQARPPAPGPEERGHADAREGGPTQGGDVTIELEVPMPIARDGGTVTATYYRQQRAENRAGMGFGDPVPTGSTVRIEDVADIRIIPGTRDGDMLREHGLGDAGDNGGPYGDLILRVRVKTVERKAPPPPPPPPPPPREQAPPPFDEGFDEPPGPSTAGAVGEVTLDVSIVEALLGGRAELTTPLGKVRVTIPPGTSSGTRMRLKGKGPDGDDLYVVTRIVVPRSLDEESRRLIEEFARLNPGSPRD